MNNQKYKLEFNKTIGDNKQFKKIIIQITKLNNGVNVYIADNITMPNILFNGIGSILDMQIGIWGMCHFFEHYIFKKTYIKGRFNACTSMNFVYFFCEDANIKYFKEIVNFFYDNDNN